MSRRLLDLSLCVYVVVCLVALVGPGMTRFGARVEPFVLGLPFALAWSVGWVLATFLVLALYHALRERAER